MLTLNRFNLSCGKQLKLNYQTKGNFKIAILDFCANAIDEGEIEKKYSLA
jgi:hypothetical protein